MKASEVPVILSLLGSIPEQCTAVIEYLLYIGNRSQKKKLANFVNLEAFVNVFLHFLISAGIFIY